MPNKSMSNDVVGSFVQGLLDDQLCTLVEVKPDYGSGRSIVLWDTFQPEKDSAPSPNRTNRPTRASKPPKRI